MSAEAQSAPEARKRYSSVELPQNAVPPFEVFCNGVPQKEGEDFVLEDRTLYFFRPIRQEEKLGFWRWLRMFIGIAGSYKQNDNVDITFDRDGKRHIETNLPITVLIEPEPHEGMIVGSYSPGG